MSFTKIRIALISSFFLFIGFQNLLAMDYKLTSPDGTVVLTISVNEKVSYTLMVDGQQVMNPSNLSMIIGNNLVLGENPKVLRKNNC